MTSIDLKGQFWPLRWIRRLYLRAYLRWVEDGIAADMHAHAQLPARIKAHERIAANVRCELALLED